MFWLELLVVFLFIAAMIRAVYRVCETGGRLRAATRPPFVPFPMTAPGRQKGGDS